MGGAGAGSVGVAGVVGAGAGVGSAQDAANGKAATSETRQMLPSITNNFFPFI